MIYDAVFADITSAKMITIYGYLPDMISSHGTGVYCVYVYMRKKKLEEMETEMIEKCVCISPRAVSVFIKCLHDSTQKV